MSRLASTIVGQARQALEAFFRGVPKIPAGTVTHTEPPVLAVGRRGLVANIDRGGRSIIRQLWSRNRLADLAATMRKRYSVRGEFQGMGKRLATFGFAGVGVAAGAKWGDSDDQEDFHFEPFFDIVQAMFGGSKSKFDRSLATLADFQSRLDDFAQSASYAESEASFDIIDELESHFSLDISDQAPIGEISMLSNAVIEPTNQEAVDNQSDEIIAPSSSSIEESQVQLSAMLHAVQTTVDTQRTELDELTVILSDLGAMLTQMSDTVPVIHDTLDDFVVIEDDEKDDDDDDSTGDDMTRLRRALALASNQQQKLNTLRRIVCEQNELLMSLAGQAAYRDIFIPRSDHCKRDACCGPGCVG